MILLHPFKMSNDNQMWTKRIRKNQESNHAHQTAFHSLHLLLRLLLFQTGMVHTSSLNCRSLAIHKGDCILNSERTSKIACQCHQGQSNAQSKLNMQSAGSKKLGLTTTRTAKRNGRLTTALARSNCQAQNSWQPPMSLAYASATPLVVVNKFCKVH